MEIIAKAKPIRFTIISNNVECATYTDLVNNFRISDVSKAVKNGSLAKWLKQQGYIDKANSLVEFQDSDFSSLDDKRRLANLITGETHNYYKLKPTDLLRSIEEEVFKWSDIDYDVIKDYAKKHVDFAIAANNNKVLKSTDKIDIFKLHEKTPGGIPLYIIGREYQANTDIPSWYKGYNYILKASQMGCQLAIDDIVKHQGILKSRLNGIDWEKYHWGMVTGATQHEKDLYQSYSWAKKLMKNIKSQNLLEQELGEIKISDTFRFEKIVLIKILTLLYPNTAAPCASVDSYLNLIKTDYPYAAELLNSKSEINKYNCQYQREREDMMRYFFNDVVAKGHPTYISFSL